VTARHRPVRTCIGCGRKRPKDELFRFVAADGVVIHEPASEGRAAYTCRRLSCFERAAAHNAFSRTLKATVQVDRELSRLYT
jgi:predicted RNA-binding protein YlxR (DUF448 family)